MENEKELIKKILSEDSEFFGDLIFKYQDFVFNVVKKWIRVEEEAEDITQDIFIKAYKKLSDFRGDSKFSVWLYRIAYTTSINWIQRKKGKEIPMEENKLEYLGQSEDPIDLTVEREMILAEIKEVIKILPLKYKVILQLHYFEEKSYKEIADILNIPINTVKIQLLRAKALLKKKFDI